MTFYFHPFRMVIFILIASFIYAFSVGKLCKRCLRSTIPTEDCSSADELSLVMSSDEQEIARSIVTAFFGNESSSTVSEVIFVSAGKEYK